MKVTYLSIWVKITNRRDKTIKYYEGQGPLMIREKNRKTKAEMAGNYS